MQYVAMIAYGVAVHAVLLMSVFDIYFQSPVLRGLEPAPPFTQHVGARARRVVLFLADGLRADKCFGARLPSTDESKFAASYLRSIAESEGVWGVSHTRVPTESRPGTVALVSGLYEDVSAITRGWKENPVEFDSIFNESRHSFCWGSPDTLSMFATSSAADRRGNVYAESYDQDMVDFGSEDPSSLDLWVLDRFTQFLTKAGRNETLRNQLSSDGIVFFFHLLGADICGHTRKPWSSEYAKTISVVDTIVNETVVMMAKYFGADANRTAFVFTADHGMTDWGSHGSSDADETETPFLAWGAGIRSPSPEQNSDRRRANYDLRSVRQDVRQADLAPLMAILLAIPIPVNSVGILPDHVLDCDDHIEWCTEALVANARQLAAQFERQCELKESFYFYRPFQGLSKAQLRTSIKSLESGSSTIRAETARHLMKTILMGIRYFETYDRLSLCICVTSGFLGWMYFVVQHLRIPSSHDDDDAAGQTSFWKSGADASTTRAIVTLIAAFMMMCLSYVQSEPPSYYVYRLFPIVTWTLVFNKERISLYERLWLLSTAIRRWNLVIFRRSVFVLVLALGLEVLVLTFFRREALAVGLIPVGLYPMLRDRRRRRRDRTSMAVAWLIVCTLMSTYAIWTPIGASANRDLVCVAGIACLAIVSAGVIAFKRSVFLGNELVVGIQLTLLLATILNRALVAWPHGDNSTLNWLIRVTSWSLLVTCNLVPLFGESGTTKRLFGLSVSVATSYLLLSYAYEALLCTVFLLLLALWWILEQQWLADEPSTRTTIAGPGPGAQASPSPPPCDELNWDDVRLAYFALFLTMLAFFGLGNVSNVNSFSLDSVFPFVTVFSPYTMGALLLCKILCPFLAVACHVHAVHEARCRSQVNLLYVVLLLCDLMALRFFYMVRDEGSWLEIGTSLGHFVIAIVTTVGFTLLHLLAKVMMTCSFNLSSHTRYKTHIQ